MKIAFIGYMGAGKSLWASNLAAKLGLVMIDLDVYLQTHYLDDTISNFIGKKGELAFRKLEKEALKSLAALEGDIVLATGGGTPCYYDNMETLNANFFTVYLNSTIKTLSNRLRTEKQHRPLISHLEDSELDEFIAKHLFERRFFYSQAKVVLNENHHELASILKILPPQV
jgi:shikimate kinase